MDGNMRRLPPWMLDGATSNRTDNKSVEVKRNIEPDAPKTKPEKRPRNIEPDASKTKPEKRTRRTVKPKERDDSEEPKKVGIKRRGRRKIGEEAKHSIDDHGNNSEIIQPATGPEEDEDLTVDDLLSFAQEYVEIEEQTRKDRESLIVSESVVIVDESNVRSSQGETEETNGTRDQTTVDMLDLLLGPFFKNSQQ